MSQADDRKRWLQRLEQEADRADAVAEWPATSWQCLKGLNALAWAVPESYGGVGCDQFDLLTGYEMIARECLTTCFLLTQRDAAIRRIVASGNDALKDEVLPGLADVDRFITVGIAQVTTSRQHTKPAMMARLQGDRVIIDGVMPWVSGAARAQHIVAGAVLDDGNQVLVLLPTATAGVAIDPPLDLMALQGSCTTSVHCREVSLSRRWLLAGPAQRVVSPESTGGLATSSLALGLARAAIEYLHDSAAARPELTETAARLEQTRDDLWRRLQHHAKGSASADAAAQLRAEANLAVLQATQAALTAAKGTGFVRPHPAQRWARQALFFLVWSCPRPAAQAVLDWLTPADDDCPAAD